LRKYSTFSAPALESLLSKSLVIWDRHCSDRLGLPHSSLTDPAGGWQELLVFEDGIAAIFQKQ
jgi:hypothetical protein